MTRDDVIRMAREAKIINGPLINYSYAEFEKLERFAALVASAEREECAKVLDEMAVEAEQDMEPSGVIAYYRSKAAAIRARKNQ